MINKKIYISSLPDFMKLWSWEENNKLLLSPTIISHGSHKEAWFKCKNNHRWIAQIQNIVNTAALHA